MNVSTSSKLPKLIFIRQTIIVKLMGNRVISKLLNDDFSFFITTKLTTMKSHWSLNLSIVPIM